MCHHRDDSFIGWDEAFLDEEKEEVTDPPEVDISEPELGEPEIVTEDIEEPAIDEHELAGDD